MLTGVKTLSLMWRWLWYVLATCVLICAVVSSKQSTLLFRKARPHDPTPSRKKWIYFGVIISLRKRYIKLSEKCETVIHIETYFLNKIYPVLPSNLKNVCIFTIKSNNVFLLFLKTLHVSALFTSSHQATQKASWWPVNKAETWSVVK
jgi:hypothetical protein